MQYQLNIHYSAQVPKQTVCRKPPPGTHILGKRCVSGRFSKGSYNCSKKDAKETILDWNEERVNKEERNGLRLLVSSLIPNFYLFWLWGEELFHASCTNHFSNNNKKKPTLFLSASEAALMAPDRKSFSPLKAACHPRCKYSVVPWSGWDSEPAGFLQKKQMLTI